MFRLKDRVMCESMKPVVPMLLVLAVLGLTGMVGRAARAGFAPWGTGGLGVVGPPGELHGDAALTRAAGSGFTSPRGWAFSGEPGSDLESDPVEDLFSGVKQLQPHILNCNY